MTGVKIPGKREMISTWRAAECKMKQHTCSPLFSQINGHFNVTRGETDVRNRQSKLRIINVTVTHTHIKNVSVTSHVDTILLRHTVILFTRHMLLHFLHSYYTLSTEGISPFYPKQKNPQCEWSTVSRVKQFLQSGQAVWVDCGWVLQLGQVFAHHVSQRQQYNERRIPTQIWSCCQLGGTRNFR